MRVAHEVFAVSYDTCVYYVSKECVRESLDGDFDGCHDVGRTDTDDCNGLWGSLLLSAGDS